MRLSLSTDHHDYSGGNPLLGLLLLLGIPAGICCCCRKKIFKQKAATTATLQVHRPVLHRETKKEQNEIGPVCIYRIVAISESQEVNKQALFSSSLPVDADDACVVFSMSMSDISRYSSYLCPRRSRWTLSSLQHSRTTRSCKTPPLPSR